MRIVSNERPQPSVDGGHLCAIDGVSERDAREPTNSRVYVTHLSLSELAVLVVSMRFAGCGCARRWEDDRGQEEIAAVLLQQIRQLRPFRD